MPGRRPVGVSGSIPVSAGQSITAAQMGEAGEAIGEAGPGVNIAQELGNAHPREIPSPSLRNGDSESRSAG